MPKVTDRWNDPDIVGSVLLDSTKKDVLVAAFAEYDRKFENLKNRADAVMAGFQSENEQLLEDTFTVVRDVLRGTDLEGVNPKEIDIETAYAQKFGFIIVRPKTEQEEEGLGALLARALAGKEVGAIEIKKG